MTLCGIAEATRPHLDLCPYKNRCLRATDLHFVTFDLTREFNRCVLLNLAGNRLSDDGTRVLCEALSTNTTLQHLILGERCVYLNSCDIGCHGAHALATMLKTNTGLHTLALHGTTLDTEGIIALCDALPHNYTLRALGIQCTDIDTDGARYMADCLSRFNASLTCLDVLGNEFDPATAAQIVVAARQRGTLRTLCGIEKSIQAAHFAHRSFSTSDAILLTFELPSLQYVNLSGNPIGDAGVEAFAAALRDNNAVRELKMQNMAGAVVAPPLVAMLHANRSLTHLDMCGNSVSADDAHAIYAALEGNDALKTLKLSDNAIPSACIQLRARMMQNVRIHLE